MTQASNIPGIEKATGKTWGWWLNFFEKIEAENLPHPKIAEMVQQELEGTLDSPGWWSQNVTVAYEQHIGRRAPGQRSDGSFEVSTSKSFVASREAVYARLLDDMEAEPVFAEQAAENIRTSVTPVRSYWKCDLEDDSKITMAVERRGDRTLLTVTHSNLDSAESAEEWREYWKQFLKNF